MGNARCKTAARDIGRTIRALWGGSMVVFRLGGESSGPVARTRAQVCVWPSVVLDWELVTGGVSPMWCSTLAPHARWRRATALNVHCVAGLLGVAEEKQKDGHMCHTSERKKTVFALVSVKH